jgi:hypothetical protein
MRTSALALFSLIAWLCGCTSERPLPLPGPPTKSGGEFYIGGAVLDKGILRVSEPPQTIAQVIIAAKPLGKLEPRTNLDVIRRAEHNTEEFHRFHWYQLENDSNWVVYADDQIMVGINEGARNCFGLAKPNPFDHRDRARE